MSGDPGDISLGLESAKGFVAKLLQAVLGFAGTIIFARLLGPTSFGGFYFLLSLVNIADRPLKGFGQAVKKRYSEVNAPREEILGATFIFAGVVVTVTGVGLALTGDILNRQTNVDGAPYVFLALFAAIGLFAPIQKLLSAAGYPAREVWNDTLRSVLTFAFQLALVSAGLGAAGMGYGLAGATLVVVPVALHFVGVKPQLPSRETVRSVWEFARYSIPGMFVGAAYGQFDTLILGALLTTATVGEYQVAYKLTIPGTFLATVLASAMMPKVSNWHSQGKDVSSAITNALAYNSVLAIPLFFGTLALSRNLVVTVYGGQYAAAAPLLVGLAAYQVVWTQTNVYRGTLSGVDLPNVRLYVDSATLVFNVVVGVALLFEFGAIGVVIATLLAESIRCLASAWLVEQHVPGIDHLPRPIWDQLIAGVVMYGTVEVGQEMIPVKSWFDLGLLVGAGAAVYWTVLLVVSGHFRNTLRSVYNEAVG